MAPIFVTDTEATKERVQTADITSEMEPQALAPTLESAPSTTKSIPKSRTNPHSQIATATATRSVKFKKRKPRSGSRATANISADIAGRSVTSADIAREKVYTEGQLRRLKIKRLKLIIQA
jgi:hypothetical protein